MPELGVFTISTAYLKIRMKNYLVSTCTVLQAYKIIQTCVSNDHARISREGTRFQECDVVFADSTDARCQTFANFELHSVTMSTSTDKCEQCLEMAHTAYAIFAFIVAVLVILSFLSTIVAGIILDLNRDGT